MADRCRSCSSFQYADGFPSNPIGFRPQSATGYGATPEHPRGDSYEQAKIPFRHGSELKHAYKGYKKDGDAYADAVSE